MISSDSAAFAKLILKDKRLLALDVSKNNIGLAAADTETEMVFPIAVIKRKKLSLDIAALNKIIEENNIGGLVIGLPLNMDGSEGPRCQSVRQFARDISKARQIPIIFFDERLSTAAAKDLLDDNAVKGDKRGGAIDKLAASFILEAFLKS